MKIRLTVPVLTLLLMVSSSALADLTTNLQLYSTMSGITPYQNPGYWEDVSGNLYDTQIDIPAYNGGGNRSTAVDFTSATAPNPKSTVYNGSDGILDPGTTDYSVSLWYYQAVTGTSFLLDNGSSASSSDGGFCLYTSGGNKYNLRMNDVARADATRTTLSYTLPEGDLLGAWHHVAAVFDRSGTASGTPNTVQLYVDNDMQVSTVLPDAAGNPYDVFMAGKEFYLGGRQTTTTAFLNGYMDDVAVYRGALSAANVNTLYNATTLNAGTITGMTPVMIHNFENNLNQPELPGALPDDYDGHPGAVYGTAEEVTDPVRGQVLQLHGASSRVSRDPRNDYVDYGDVLDPGSSSYTVALWFKISDTGAGQIVASKGMNSGSGNEGWAIAVSPNDLDPESPELILRANYDGTSDNRLGITKTFSFDEWHHVALVIDQDNGVLKGYLDGVDSGLSGMDNGWSIVTDYFNTFTPGEDFDSAEALALGYSSGAKSAMNGCLDDFAIWDRALSDAEIRSLAIPEPSTLVLLMLGLVGWMIAGRGGSR